jgi:Zn-dependent M28 family amino/carboxypeptidase
VCDVGRGTPADFERHAAAIAARFVVVRHEYPFSTETVHRRRKLAMAMEKGAAGFIIANPFPGAGAVAGSSGRGGAAGIPAVGTDHESSVRLSAASGSHARVRVVVAAEDYAGETSALILDVPGRTREWVVLSAHVDGHDLAESAMDNATGVAAALAIARAVAPRIAECERGLRVCIFSAEEWALAGSRQYLDTMADEERARIAFNVNLDTLGGDERFTALTSDFPKLDAYVQTVASESGLALGTHLPVMSNSDHYNFARHGIPALRVVAGFNRPDSDIRLILTRGDTRDRVKPAQLAEGARIAATLVWRALTAKSEALRDLRK